jgi:hypothetical protein
MALRREGRTPQGFGQPEREQNAESGAKAKPEAVAPCKLNNEASKVVKTAIERGNALKIAKKTTTSQHL